MFELFFAHLIPIIKVVSVKKILISFILFSSLYGIPSRASKYSIETLVRSFPIGAFSKFNLGKSYKFWGDKSHQKDITYGFVRPELEFRTSGLVNYAGGKVFIYPLPILGLFTGAEKGIRGLDNLDTFNLFPPYSGAHSPPTPV